MDGESAEQREARHRSLWDQLDRKNTGSLDLAGLKQGLTRMNHPLKDADGMIRDMLTACDINHDGKITYDEFRRFCDETEKQLWKLFQSIDRDHNGNLDKSELSLAFEKAGVAVSNIRLDRFFSYIDTNHDGHIDFPEWRDFLLFLPTNAPGLQAIFSYYNTAVKLTSEGDVDVSHEALSGLGTTSQFLKNSLFGVLLPIAGISSPRPHRRSRPWTDHDVPSSQSPIPETSQKTLYFHDDSTCLPTRSQAPIAATAPSQDISSTEDLENPQTTARDSRLTRALPHIGYFIAGGLAGITSRTATAPLDRLKVYLIAQTAAANEAVVAAKSGAPILAAKHGTRTLVQACKDLWAAGGVRSLFVGNGLNVLKVVPESGVKFGAFEFSKRMVAKFEGHHDPKRIPGWSVFMCGGTAGMFSQAVVYPLDTLKFRTQCETVPGAKLKGNALVIDTARKMWQQNGIRSYYRGLSMGLIGMFPYAAIDLFLFESLKRAIVKRNMRLKGTKHEEDALPGNFSLALIGGFSGALGASAVYPINLLRTRLQSQGTAGHPRVYTGIVDVTRQTIRGEGVRGLFKGLTPNLLKVVPAVSITYVVYENTKKALQLS